MKNHLITKLILALGIIFMTSCKKDDDDDKETLSNSVIAEFAFNQESDLGDWTFSSNDSAFMIIDFEDKVEGAGSLKIEDGCSSIINMSGKSIAKSESYKITLSVKYDKFEPMEWCGGAYNLALVLIQGSEMEWFSIYQEKSGWYALEFYYQSNENGLPVQFRVYNGMKNLWIDNLVIEEAE